MARALAGFTLIELIITLAIAAILLTLAAPSFQTMLAKNRVAGLTNELSASLQLARSEAIKRGKTITVCKCADPTATTLACDTTDSASWTSGWLVYIGTYTASPALANILRVGQPASTNVIQGGTDFKKSVSYYSSGTSSGSGNEAARTLTICVAPEQRKIIISRTGQIQISTGTCT